MVPSRGGWIDHFELQELLGVGAVADVYRAVDSRDGHPVTLKVPRSATLANPELMRRFRRERVVTAQLHHPLIQANLDDRTHRSCPYLVLEFVEGSNLRSEMTACGGAFGEDQIRSWMLDLADALDHVHRAGFLHCDLKPENVIIDTDGRARLIDFGDATDVRKRPAWWSLTSGLQGTPEYLSPEQILGRPLAATADLYSFGVIFFELLTGCLPFVGEDVDATLNSHLWQQVPSDLSDRPDISDELVDLIHRLMRRDARDRPASAGDVRDALASVQADDRSFSIPNTRHPIGDPPARGSAASAARRQLLKLVSTIVLAVVVLATSAITASVLLR